MSNVVVMTHPLIQHKIGVIRRVGTGSRDFRAMIKKCRAKPKSVVFRRFQDGVKGSRRRADSDDLCV